MEEMGRSLFPAPYLSTVILCSNLLLELGNEDQKQAHLPGIAAGESVWSLALTEPSGHWEVEAVELAAAAEHAAGRKHLSRLGVLPHRHVGAAEI